MPTPLDILRSVAPVFLIIATGMLCRRFGLLTREADETLHRLVINLFFPCLILTSILGNPAAAEVGNMAVAPVIGFLMIGLGFAGAGLISLLIFPRNSSSRRPFAFSGGIQNYAFIPIMLIMMVFEEGKETVGVLFLHNIGVEFCIWAVGVMILTAGRSANNWKNLLNAPLIALVCATVGNPLGGRALLPEFLWRFIDTLAVVAVPLGVMLAGATVFDNISGIEWKKSWKIIMGSCAFRLGLIPLVYLALAILLPCSTELKRVLLVEAAMPAGMFSIVIVRRYGHDPYAPTLIILSTTLLSLFTIPLWLSLGFNLIPGLL